MVPFGGLVSDRIDLMRALFGKDEIGAWASSASRVDGAVARSRPRAPQHAWNQPTDPIPPPRRGS